MQAVNLLMDSIDDARRPRVQTDKGIRCVNIISIRQDKCRVLNDYLPTVNVVQLNPLQSTGLVVRVLSLSELRRYMVTVKVAFDNGIISVN